MTPRARTRVTYLALTVAAILVLIDAVIGVRLMMRRSHPTVAQPEYAPALMLVDGGGRAAPLVDPASPATLVFFGYTHCRDSCPIGLATIAHALARLAGGPRVRAVFVTVDPKRDTPQVVARYVASFDPAIVGLTGSQRALAEAEHAFSIGVQPSSKEIAHGDAIYLVDTNRHIVAVYPPSGPPANVARDVRALMR